MPLLALALAPSGTETQPTELAFEPLAAPASTATAAAAPALVPALVDSSTFSDSYVDVGATRLDLDAIDDEAQRARLVLAIPPFPATRESRACAGSRVLVVSARRARSGRPRRAWPPGARGWRGSGAPAAAAARRGTGP